MRKKRKITGIIVNGEKYKIQRTKSNRMCSLCELRGDTEEKKPDGRVMFCNLCLAIDDIINTSKFYFKKEKGEQA